jgi:hypothetical protein
LLRWASAIEKAAETSAARLSESLFTKILEGVPDDWLLPEPGNSTPGERRKGYVDYLTRRLAASPKFVQEAQRGRAELV